MKQLFFISLVVLFSITKINAQNLINHKGNNIFLQGINLAWMSFGNDLVGFNEEKFESIMKDVASVGGNSVRWWIHVEGQSTPTYLDDTVVGISEVGLNNLERALDIAAENDIVVSLCLWSFDMMAKQKDSENEATALARTKKNRILLEDSAATQAYIEKALIPMVEKLKGHTAILCWEIFNEPEGMTTIANWNHVENVDIKYIQRFINRCAGAIHRTDPEAKVSNGSWNARACVEISSIYSSKNYYSDAALIAEGGDLDGTLDFYMLHFYPQHVGDKSSPFHNPVEYWELDKPFLIGEFPADGIMNEGSGFKPSSELTPTEAYAYLYDNGYAGAWAWTYTGHDGNGDLSDIAYVLDSLKTAHTDSIAIPRNPNHNYAPTTVASISDTILYVNSNTVNTYINLNNYFTDEEQLAYTIEANGPAVLSFTNDTILNISVIPDSTGLSLFTVVATDIGGKKTDTRFNIVVRDSIIISDNKLLQTLVSSSSEENDERRRVFINDGSLDTRWSSIYNDDEWVEFDMLESNTISRVVLYWEAAYGDSYQILLSTDKINWDTVASVTKGQTNINNIIFPAQDAQYIRIKLNDRATSWGYSLFEVEAYTNNTEPRAFVI